jgi:hypothetical protein
MGWRNPALFLLIKKERKNEQEKNIGCIKAN